MKLKYLDIRVKQCLTLAEASPCPRRKFGAVLIDPESNTVLADGFNGAPRGGGRLCGGEICARDAQNVLTGTRMEVGCHHAETNTIANAARHGTRTLGAWLIVTGEPCLMCAKLIHHAGIARVVLVGGGYAGGSAGPDYLRKHGVEIVEVDGPKDPRGAAVRAVA